MKGLCLACYFSLIFCISGISQNLPSRISAVERSGFSTEPFDIEASKADPHFKGHDIVALANFLRTSKALSQKSEFETSQKYAERMAGFVTQPLFGSMRADSYWVFVCDDFMKSEIWDKDIPSSTIRYDADRQMLIISIALGYAVSGSPNQSLSILSSMEEIGTHPAQNAFGARFDVTDQKILGYELVGPVFGGRRKLEGSKEINLGIAMTSEQANKLKPRIKVIAVCQLSLPWYTHRLDSDSATISSPRQTHFETHEIYVNFRQLWIIDDETGLVLTRWNFPSVGEKGKSRRK